MSLFPKSLVSQASSPRTNLWTKDATTWPGHSQRDLIHADIPAFDRPTSQNPLNAYGLPQIRSVFFRTTVENTVS
jgi:hypothetical protein